MTAADPLVERLLAEVDHWPRTSTLDPLLRQAVARIEALTRDVERYKVAWEEYDLRTEWVQQTAQPKELGLHRADVLRARIEALEAEVAVRAADYETLTQLWRGDEATYRIRAEQAEADRDRLREAIAAKAKEWRADSDRYDDMHSAQTGYCISFEYKGKSDTCEFHAEELEAIAALDGAAGEDNDR